jgi:hypothetical protein
MNTYIYTPQPSPYYPIIFTEAEESKRIMSDENRMGTRKRERGKGEEKSTPPPSALPSPKSSSSSSSSSSNFHPLTLPPNP